MTDATTKIVNAVSDAVKRDLEARDAVHATRINEILAAIQGLTVQVSALVADKESRKKPPKVPGEKAAAPKGTSSVPTFGAWFQKDFAANKDKYAALLADPEVAKTVKTVEDSAPYKKTKTDATKASHIAKAVYNHCTTAGKAPPAAWQVAVDSYEAVKNVPVAVPEAVTPV